MHARQIHTFLIAVLIVLAVAGALASAQPDPAAAPPPTPESVLERARTYLLAEPRAETLNVSVTDHLSRTRSASLRVYFFPDEDNADLRALGVRFPNANLWIAGQTLYAAPDNDPGSPVLTRRIERPLLPGSIADLPVVPIPHLGLLLPADHPGFGNLCPHASSIFWQAADQPTPRGDITLTGRTELGTIRATIDHPGPRIREVEYTIADTRGRVNTVRVVCSRRRTPSIEDVRIDPSDRPTADTFTEVFTHRPSQHNQPEPVPDLSLIGHDLAETTLPDAVGQDPALVCWVPSPASVDARATTLRELYRLAAEASIGFVLVVESADELLDLGPVEVLPAAGLPVPVEFVYTAAFSDHVFDAYGADQAQDTEVLVLTKDRLVLGSASLTAQDDPAAVVGVLLEELPSRPVDQPPARTPPERE